MNEKIFFEWATDTIIITIVYHVIIIGSLLYLYKEFTDTDSRARRLGMVAIAVFLVGVNIFLSTMTPLYVKYNDEEIRIECLIGGRSIRYDDITEIQSIGPDMLSRSVRKMASGGANGYVGLFSNKKLGNYYMYATQKSNLVLITTPERKYVISCSAAEQLVEYVKNKI